MINDTFFVQQSLLDNLFFLRTIKEYCVNIQLSFFQNEQEYITTAYELYQRGDELLQRALSLSNGNFLTGALEDQIFVTKYTLPMELLTEKLFDIKLNTSLTEEELNLKTSAQLEITEELIAQVEQLNIDSLAFTDIFIDFTSHIYQRLNDSEIFSYSYPDIFRYMTRVSDIYQKDLERLLQRSGADPVYISDFGYYFSQSLLSGSQFIRGLSNPSQLDVIQRASFFENEFGKFMSDYQSGALNPSNQQDIMRRELSIVIDYKTFLEEIIQGIIDSNLYFIVEGLFFDNLYTEVNYFISLLRKVVESQNKK